MEDWSFEDLAERYDPDTDADPSTDDESTQITLIKRQQ